MDCLEIKKNSNLVSRSVLRSAPRWVLRSALRSAPRWVLRSAPRWVLRWVLNLLLEERRYLRLDLGKN